MILKRELIPIQDDPENGGWLGSLRPGANTHAERRGPDEGTDSGVPERQRGNRIQRAKPRRALRLGAAGFGGARICRARQEAAGTDSSLHRQDDGTQPATSDAADPQVSRRGVVEAAPYRRQRFAVKYNSQD